MMDAIPTLDDIHRAAQRVEGRVHRTPTLGSATLARQAGLETLLLKCENLQKTGAFKARGACNAVFALSASEAAAGVVTHSSGNHGAALAWAAQLRGIPAFVVMPHDAPAAKRQAVQAYGATVLSSEPTLASRQQLAQRVIEERGATLVHPYDDPQVIAGQGTATLELLADHPNLDAIIAPISGGGLLSGTAIVAAAATQPLAVYGAEPANADDAQRSLRSGHLVAVDNLPTIADGLRASLSVRTFTILQRHVRDIFTVSEAEILAAMRLVWERCKLVIEPSSAVPIAALLQRPAALQGRRVGVILSGGNLDLGAWEGGLPWLS